MSEDSPTNQPNGQPGCDRLTRAVDSAARANFDASRLEAGGAHDAERLLGVLALLDEAPVDAGRSSLVDVTMARLVRQGREGVAGRVADGVDSPLTPRSREALDELVDASWSARGEAGAQLHPLAHLLSLSEAEVSAQDRDGLVAATMRHIDDAEAARANRFRLSPVDDRPSRGRFRLADLSAVAAMLLFGAAVMWPMLVSMRINTTETLCQANMQAAGFAIGNYAADHDGRLPSVEAPSSGPVWWGVGTPGRSHSANLFHLVTTGYARVCDLACPGNCDAVYHIDSDQMAQMRDWRTSGEVSYSYQLFGDVVPRLSDDPRMVVLTDRSPAVERARMGESIDPAMGSRNHGGRGQHVLFGDGTVIHLDRPTLNGDNIWLPRAAEGEAAPRLDGTELPSRRGDAFVGP